MPELPEVETTVRGLQGQLLGQVIVDVHNQWPRHIDRPSWPEFQQRIRGRVFRSAGRRGKYLVFRLDQGETLIIHLKMSGQLAVVENGVPADKHVHTIFSLGNGQEFRFRDIRKFGRVYLVHDPQEVLGKLGLEPFSEQFTSEWLYEKLNRRHRVLKPLLLDQSFIAGIGNIYADEALHRARIHPIRHSNTLSRDEAQALHAAIQQVLQLGLDRGGATIDQVYRQPDGSQGNMQSEFSVYGRAGEPCFRCQGTVERLVLAGRGTHFCNLCQL